MIAEPGAEQLVWVDGNFVPWPQATIHVSSHHYGFAVFEGVRVYATDDGAAIFRLADHTKRLFRSAHMMKLAIPPAFSAEVLNQAQVELSRRNHFGDAYLRPFVYLDGVMGLRPCSRDLAVHVAIIGVDWRGGAPQRGPGRGVTLKTSSFQHAAAGSVLAKAKANGNYVAGMLALDEAQSSGADDALLLDHQGFVTETSGANLFVVRDGQLQTPPLCSVLEGITRETVMTLAAEASLRCVERQLTREDVYAADEVFLTGTASEVTPVVRVDGRTIGTGTIGPVTLALQESYQAHVRGRAPRRAEWLTRVNVPKTKEVEQ